ncbi:hypothetical protein DFH09DRAFT_1336858 [Mycena vulgaris]|nr:hypothetical protein DFH09DRAFT_1336858 [Mycena vulgaris]
MNTGQETPQMVAVGSNDQRTGEPDPAISATSFCFRVPHNDSPLVRKLLRIENHQQLIPPPSHRCAHATPHPPLSAPPANAPHSQLPMAILPHSARTLKTRVLVHIRSVFILPPSRPLPLPHYCITLPPSLLMLALLPA